MGTAVKNTVSESIKPLMIVAAVLDAKEFLMDVADALEEAKKEDMAKMVRLIVSEPDEAGNSMN